jgi:hypothetical protein
MEDGGMKKMFEVHNQDGVFLLFIKVGIAFLGITTLLYIFWPTTLNTFAEFFSLRQALINPIKAYPGFDQDWLSVVSLVTVSVYIWLYSYNFNLVDYSCLFQRGTIFCR